ncbi:uncharacterized protein LOC62_02G003480 [Vanrija pseudolonga]|uniref:Uncharacterized protein n=1 Tax=Vanrija pseudolonga TaxID=143232 RepID=A0AAF1BKS9_9TREE|nr:hypothetical protein LOC62_02G003480 [Vanrija pseudolonga]
MLLTKALAILFTTALTAQAIPDVADARQGASNNAISFAGTDPDLGGVYTSPYPGEKDAQGFTVVNSDGEDGEIDANSANSKDKENETYIAGTEGFAAIVQLVANYKTEGERRDHLVKALTDYVFKALPDFNVIIFKRNMGFGWRVENGSRSNFAEMTVVYKDEPTARETAYGIVVFKGRGTLWRNGADGGWRNWGISGRFSSPDGDQRIEFY